MYACLYDCLVYVNTTVNGELNKAYIFVDDTKEEDAAGPSTADDTGPPCKRFRVTPSKGKRDMLAYLEKKSDDTKNTELKQMEVRREELQLSKDRFEMEARQRDAQMEEDRREKIEASKFRQQELDLKREEMELSKARFELERKEREARIESEKNEKGMMFEMMRTLLNRQ